MSNYLIAVTGGIGSGKSTVTNLIKELGYTVFSADEVYKNMLKDDGFFKGVLNSVGVEFNGDKTKALKEVSSLVFRSKEALNALNNYTHPKIMQKMFELNAGVDGIVFNEVPLLFEGDYQHLYNEVIIVIRNLEDRIKSVSKRDGLTMQEIKERIKNQFNYENNAIFKHTVIYNDGTDRDLAEKVRAVVNEIVKKV
ncbi:MAG: dephospho-CoA kinase [Clostridia bacterium]|nr:dephospho-CoA kinase [Clostridia bacterium]